MRAGGQRPPGWWRPVRRAGAEPFTRWGVPFPLLVNGVFGCLLLGAQTGRPLAAALLYAALHAAALRLTRADPHWFAILGQAAQSHGLRALRRRGRPPRGRLLA